MEQTGKYVFNGCSFRFEWFKTDPMDSHFCEYELDYPEGTPDFRAAFLAQALEDTLGLKLLSTVDNYFTFDISENICIHPSVWYRCNVVDKDNNQSQINVKLSAIRHRGAYI